jgi:hypothetical protein
MPIVSVIYRKVSVFTEGILFSRVFIGLSLCFDRNKLDEMTSINITQHFSPLTAGGGIRYPRTRETQARDNVYNLYNPEARGNS